MLKIGTKVRFTEDWLSKSDPKYAQRFRGRIGVVHGYRAGSTQPIVVFPKDGRKSERKLFEVDTRRLEIVDTTSCTHAPWTKGERQALFEALSQYKDPTQGRMEQKICKVRGLIAPNGMCAEILCGGHYCGSSNACEHQGSEVKSAPESEERESDQIPTC